MSLPENDIASQNKNETVENSDEIRCKNQQILNAVASAHQDQDQQTLDEFVIVNENIENCKVLKCGENSSVHHDINSSKVNISKKAQTSHLVGWGNCKCCVFIFFIIMFFVWLGLYYVYDTGYLQKFIDEHFNK